MKKIVSLLTVVLFLFGCSNGKKIECQNSEMLDSIDIKYNVIGNFKNDNMTTFTGTIEVVVNNSIDKNQTEEFYVNLKKAYENLGYISNIKVKDNKITLKYQLTAKELKNLSLDIPYNNKTSSEEFISINKEQGFSCNIKE